MLDEKSTLGAKLDACTRRLFELQQAEKAAIAEFEPIEAEYRRYKLAKSFPLKWLETTFQPAFDKWFNLYQELKKVEVECRDLELEYQFSNEAIEDWGDAYADSYLRGA